MYKVQSRISYILYIYTYIYNVHSNSTFILFVMAKLDPELADSLCYQTASIRMFYWW